MIRISLLALLSALLFVDDARSAALPGEGIQGGEDAQLGEYAYQVSLQRGSVSFCGGTILDESHVVTAAHCVLDPIDRFVLFPMEVVAGIDSLLEESDTLVRARVEKVYVPVDYGYVNVSVRTIADIAVLKLEEPLDLNSNPNLSKVDLPEDQENKFVGVEADVTGFGVNSVDMDFNPFTNSWFEYNHIVLGKMRVAKTKVIRNEKCQEYYRTKPISDTHVCAFVEQRKPDEPEGVCGGDSGGPLVYDGVLIGVISSSPLGCREDAKPAVYTRISSYLDFIRKAVRDEADASIRAQVLPLDYDAFLRLLNATVMYI